MERPGKVFLVGAGPGDPDLLTRRAARLLESARVLVFDRLISDAVLAMAPASAEQHYVGKTSGCHALSQPQINALLVRLARSGRDVVRLKGGDPFTFGRGGEEMLHCLAQGVPCEIVPGITAAAGCAAALGLPLTHRGVATGVRFATGHARDNGALELDWAACADPQTTLVVYMGLAMLPQIAAQLSAAGLSDGTPLLAVENGTTERQRQLVSTLAAAEADLAAAGFRSPTLLIIGQVVALMPGLPHVADGRMEDFGADPSGACTTPLAVAGHA